MEAYSNPDVIMPAAAGRAKADAMRESASAMAAIGLAGAYPEAAGGHSLAEEQGENPDAIGLKLKCGSDIVSREQHWIVDQFLPDDSLVVVAGQVGLGKTTACMDWAASITNGRVPITGGKRMPGNVLMLSNEDSEASLRRIFERLRGNLSRLYVEDEDSELPWGIGDVPALEAQITSLRPVLVIIDSLTTHKPTRADLNSHGDVAPLLVALRKVAAAHQCAIVLIHHTNKLQTGDPLTKISGSIGISATARHVILMARHPEDETLRVAAIVKSNLAKPGAVAYKFSLDPFRWEGPTPLTGSDLLQGGDDSENTPSAAEEFLRECLREGRESATKLIKTAKTEYDIPRRTLQNAASRLGVIREYSGFGADRKVYWKLPPTMDATVDAALSRTGIDGAEPIGTPLFNAGLTMDASLSESGINGGIDVASMEPSPCVDSQPGLFEEGTL